MRTRTALFLSMSLAAVVAGSAGDASACGGCFVEDETTQVVGHRMILSVSPTASTLWDQIEYSGDPASWAWVLPIKGQVDVGVSSDALFQVLQQTTQVTITSPYVSCGGGTGGSGGFFGGAGGSGGGGGSDNGVTIIDQEVVGPYESVQLSSADPQALTMWLTSHGYAIPASIQPVIDDYVAEGFGFLALKLVPGQGVSSMKPVRITTPGAGPVLPLRMVAAGTGAKTAIQLWVFSEGRYEPANFPSFTIKEEDLVWDWNTDSSNYAQLRQQGYDDTSGLGWLVDFSEGVQTDEIANVLDYSALDQYADEDGMNAQANLQADMQALYGALDPGALRVTHMLAELPQAALANDLQLQASADQGYVSPYLQADASVGDPCGNGNSGGSGGGGGNGGGSGGSGGVDGGKGSCNCGVAGADGNSGLATLALGVAAATVMFRRRRRA